MKPLSVTIKAQASAMSVHLFEEGMQTTNEAGEQVNLFVIDICEQDKAKLTYIQGSDNDKAEPGVFSFKTQKYYDRRLELFKQFLSPSDVRRATKYFLVRGRNKPHGEVVFYLFRGHSNDVWRVIPLSELGLDAITEIAEILEPLEALQFSASTTGFVSFDSLSGCYTNQVDIPRDVVVQTFTAEHSRYGV